MLVILLEIVLEGRLPAFVVNFVKPLEEAIERVVGKVLLQIEVAAKFLNGVAKFHILVVIRLVILAESFKHFYALLVAVRAYKACKERDVLALVKITHKPHKDGFVALVFGKDFHKHFARFAVESVDFVNHILKNRLAVFQKVFVRFEPLVIGQILAQKNVEFFEHFLLGFHVGSLIILLHRLLRKSFCSICQTFFH